MNNQLKVRRLAALIFGMTLTLNAQATLDGVEYCTQISDLSESIMEARQEGVDMAKMMSVVGDKVITRSMIIMAYDEPRYQIEEYKRKAVVKFRNRVFRLCYSQFEK